MIKTSREYFSTGNYQLMDIKTSREYFSTGNYQLMDDKNIQGIFFHRELPAHG
jgi:hypothetical protein